MHGNWKMTMRILAVLMALMVSLSVTSVGVRAAVASDVDGHWARTAIVSLMTRGIVNGYPDGTFRPEGAVTRAEFMSLMNGAFGYRETTDLRFPDVPATSWFASVVAVARKAGYATGYPDGTMRPNQPITREEAAGMLAFAGQFAVDGAATDQFTDQAMFGWGRGAIGAVASIRLMVGYPDGSFMPARFIRRGEAATVILRAMDHLSTVALGMDDIPLGSPVVPPVVETPAPVVSPVTTPTPSPSSTPTPTPTPAPTPTPDADQAAPTGLTGIAPTTADNDDGIITGTAVSMQYKTSGAAVYAAVTGSAITGLVPGDYLVRYAAKSGFRAGAAAVVVVPQFTPPNLDQAAPTGLAGIAPTAADKADGIITGTAISMEYKVTGAVAYAAVTGSAITGLAPGDYLVRLAAKTGYNAGAAASVTVPSWLAPVTTPAAASVLFTFDDAWLSQLDNALPIMEAAGFKGTAYVNRDTVWGTDPLIMRMNGLNTLYEAGWDLSNHTTNHQERWTFVGDEMLPLEDAVWLPLMRTAFLDNQNWLEGADNDYDWSRGARHACYPSGTYTPELLDVLSDIGVLTARTVDPGNVPSGTGQPLLTLPMISLETNVANVKAHLDEAVMNGSTVIIMIHRVEDVPGDLVVSKADFQSVVDYAAQLEAAGSIQVRTISQWYDSLIP